MRQTLRKLFAGTVTSAVLACASPIATATPADVGLSIPAGVSSSFSSNWVVDTLVGQRAGLTTGGFSGGTFLRTNTGNVEYRLTLELTGLGAHDSFDLGLIVAQLDSVDPNRDDDLFRIFIDDVEYLQVGLGFGVSPPFSEPFVSNYEIGGVAADINDVLATQTASGALSTHTNFVDHMYDFGNLAALQNIAHTGSTLKIDIVAQTNQTWTNEAYGIDNLSVGINFVPEPAPLALCGLGLLLAGSIRKRRSA